MKNKQLLVKKEWKDLGRSTLLEGEGFSISYAKNPGAEIESFAATNGGDETALCKDGKYFILNGDWREDYELLIAEGFSACKKFFDKNNVGANVSHWSD